MKRKPKAPRNPFAAAAKFKKAGTHTKPEKALRRANKVSLSGYSSKVEQSAFTRSAMGSIPSAPTRAATQACLGRAFLLQLYQSIP